MKRRTFRVDRRGLLAAAVAHGLSADDAEARALIARGAVYLDGRRCLSPAAPVGAGQTVMVVLEERGQPALAAPAPPVPLRILFEDAQVLAVDKPAGITAQPTPSRVGESLVDLASHHLGRTAGLVHRLDRETSGVTVFGKTPEATRALAAAFRKGTARKQYLAIAAGELPERGVIDLKLSRDPKRPGRFRASPIANGVTARTRYERLGAVPGVVVVALFPETGRTHQLRAHLAALGAPIAGDVLYGGPRELLGFPAPRVLLHAQRLVVPHPATGAPLELESPVPDELQRFVDRIR
ncbi:MAG: RluA family pseudouridine synthase [Myxococcaceae bacterium]|nr:RluA family pseudouridine synthase [Myxococcaceae bacterium]